MASARTFDLKIQVGGSETTFSSINKEEHELVESFLKSKKLRVKNEINDDMLTGAIPQLDDDEDSDEDMASAQSSEDDKRAKRKDKGKSSFKAKPAMDEDSEEEGAQFRFFLAFFNSSTSMLDCVTNVHLA